MSLRGRVAGRVSLRSRARKVRHVEELISDGAHVLAVGVSDPGYSGSHNQVETALAKRTSLVGLYYHDIPGLAERVPFQVFRGDGCKLPFRDNAFDYVISNAVIEHVGDENAQRGFLSEARRVASRGVFHTTPNRWGPVETHTHLILLHWLPRSWHGRLLTRPGRYQWQETDRLLSRREFERLAGPGATTSGWPRVWPLTWSLTHRFEA